MDKMSIQEKIENGEEYLYPGRRNFFSPVVHYKCAKARFYNENGTYFSQTEVPLERWEVDMLCEDNKISSSVVWNSMPQNKKKRRSFEEMEADCAKNEIENISPTKIPEQDFSVNYVDSIFNMTVSDVFEDDFSSDDISIRSYIDTSLEQIDKSVDLPFKQAEMLEQVAKLETCLDQKSQLDIDNRGKVFSDYYGIILHHCQRQQTLTTTKLDAREEIKSNIKLCKKLNNEKINQFKEFKYDYLETAAGVSYDRGNILDHIARLVESIGKEPEDKILKKFENKLFLFLHGNYVVRRKQRVCLIPSGGGKTTIFKKYHKYVMDIDYLRVLNNDEEYFDFLMMYSRTFNRWHVINTYWKYILFKFQKFYCSRILLCHSIHQLPFFSDGLQLASFIANKNEDYNVRFFKQNVQSIQDETNIIFRDHINLGFLRIYQYFMVHKFEYEHHQFYKGRKIICENLFDSKGVYFKELK